MNASLTKLFTLAKNTNTRIPIILCGQRDWSLDLLSKAFSENLVTDYLIVSSDPIKDAFGSTVKGSYDSSIEPSVRILPAEKMNTLLGTEVGTIVWDGFSGLNPSALGAASGLVRAGGLFCLCLPELEKLSSKPDPDYKRMCSFESELSSVTTHFLKGLLSLCSTSTCAILEQNRCDNRHSQDFALVNSEFFTGQSTPQTISLPSPDQYKALEAITKVSQGRRNRPLVLSADRGRGKTSVLGIAAAELVNEHKHKIVVTAPTKRAVTPLFKHFDANLTVEASPPAFYSPDELLRAQPECHLLLVDEAAAIPSALLKQICSCYKRIVFATTIHGYEGSGRGFEIRFKKHLDSAFPGWHEIHMETSIRWANNDPLERWTERLLHLKTGKYHYQEYSDSKNIEFKWIKQEELFDSSQLLDQTISLLVNAHYQTTPDDIRIILDHPRLSIGILLASASNKSLPPLVIGVVLLMQEGRIEDQMLRQEILLGKRRLRGHLAPQSLACAIYSDALLSQSYLRVMRIAVAPEFEKRGYGSELIKHSKKFAVERQINILCTSFGLSNELVHFWSKNGFEFLKLGTHKDSTTGTYSAILGLNCSEHPNPAYDLSREAFGQELLFGFSRQYRNHNSSELVLILVANRQFKRELNAHLESRLRAYTDHHRQFHDSANDISELILVSCNKGNLLDNLSITEAALMICAVFQGRSVEYCVKAFKLKGKREFDEKLRIYTGSLLNSLSS